MNTKAIGETGELDYPVKVPDTITQWNVDAFCTSTVGLGFSPRIGHQVFKPYFVELNMPYSVKQGETLVLKANVFNFMRQCIKVNTNLYPSKDFQLLPCDDCLHTACLCGNPSDTFTWNIKPLILGAINITIGTEALETNELCDGQTPVVPTNGKSDIVQKRLLVEAHGIPVENTRSLILCASKSETIPLELPTDVVLGSQSAKCTVTGDVMGKPLNNLNSLVRLPTGCGEQNMILLAPVIKIYNYSHATAQMTTALSNKAKGYMETGYQNQLKFKHKDGSYSAFGSSDSSGSTWLTAFVARFFFPCQNVINIEYRHITEALDWLKKQQQSNGCFQSVGRVIHKELMGGVDSQIALTAYVTSTFVEVNNPKYNDVIEKAKKCLQNCTEAQSSIYTKAQCAYTYTLLGDKVKRTQLLKQLDEVAIKKDDKIHWSTKSVVPKADPLWPKPNSADVETTSYVVLAMVSGKDPSKTDLAAAVPAIRWIYSQQNANGGFASTQDTVVALSAVSAYYSKTFANQSLPTINITNNKGFRTQVILKPTKLSEVHVVALPDNPAVYTLKALGSGCAYVQITERYNILNPEPEGTFILQVKTSSIQCPPHPAPSFNIQISVSLSDASNNKGTNMALVEIKPVSGFVPNSDTVDRLLINEEVKRVENKQTGVTIYLEKITSTPLLLSIDMEQQCEVRDLHPAVVSVTDYYEPLKHIEKTYRNPCK
ncbi:alpha-2-macroglobulin-like [Eleutherodactylus coqui]|uniref:alpha-2-macroglobulin-like n=1 Tax=Eleutherodactylus coqui TaxID=57060 RepID=UPI0034634443